MDQYDGRLVDDNQYSELSIGDQMEVDAMLNRRDRISAKRNGQIPSAFMGGDGEDDDYLAKMRRRRRHRGGARVDEAIDEGDEYDPGAFDPDFVLDDLKGRSIAEWIVLEQPRQQVAHRFRKFLLEYVDANGNSVYEEKIQRMCEMNEKSLEVSYIQLHEVQTLLALWVGDAPVEMLKIFDEVAVELVKERFEFYDRISSSIHVRITDLPTEEKIRDLRHFHVNKLVKIRGVITRRSAVLPEMKYVTFACAKCSHLMGPFFQQGGMEVKINHCSSCNSRGPFNVRNEQSGYRDYQKLNLQEAPGSVPPGRLPRYKEVILLDDLVDSVRPGEEVEITGIYRNVYDISLNATNGFPLFATIIEANHVNKQEDRFAGHRLTPEDKMAIMELSRDPRVAKRIIKSIAPSIYGHEDIKTGIALSMFGGVSKDIQGKHRLRGDINILLMGDPGTAKSQFLKYVEKTANRAVFTTGQGASAVGLTAAVHKSPVTREWTLEGGALVLADKGVCLIDEFDKMNDQDRTSIHEAMEQQSISVSKAGIVCSLQARCAVIAAANPKSGRYNAGRSFQENVQLTEPILSRFDILCVVKDVIDVENDERLARFVVDNHIRSHPDQGDDSPAVEDRDADILDQDLLRKYIMYARENIHPRLNQLDQEKLARVYSSLRKESMATGSIPMTVRHVESMIRMAESHAKMHLRDFVRQDDLDVAVRVMLESFLGANKISVAKSLRRKFRRYLVSTGDNDELLHHLLKTLANEHFQYKLYDNPTFRRAQANNEDLEMLVDKIEFDAEEFEWKARELNIHDVSHFYKSRLFTSSGYCVEERVNNQNRMSKFIVKQMSH